jgi:phage shock protein B
MRGNPSRQSKQQWDEETRLIQELHQGLSRMDNRIEALEMILLDPERKRKDERIF